MSIPESITSAGPIDELFSQAPPGAVFLPDPLNIASDFVMLEWGRYCNPLWERPEAAIYF